MTTDCTHPSGELTERGTIYCADCGCEYDLDGVLRYDMAEDELRQNEVRCFHCLATVNEAHASCCMTLGAVNVPWRAIA